MDTMNRTPQTQLASRMPKCFVNSGYNLQNFSFPVHVKLLTETIITVQVGLNSTIQYLCDQIRQFHSTLPLKWPTTSRLHRSPARLPTCWSASAALRLYHHGRELHRDLTLVQSDLLPESRLSAHMYFSEREKFGEVDVCKSNWRRSKRTITITEHHEEQFTLQPKRRKYNEPLRNQHIHRMVSLSAGLQTSRENAARYGLDVDEMEDILEELDDIDFYVDI